VRGRRARPEDAVAVHRLIAHYAAEGLLLPRTEVEIYAHIGRFLVLVELPRLLDDRLLGCVALSPTGRTWLRFAHSPWTRKFAAAAWARGCCGSRLP